MSEAVPPGPVQVRVYEKAPGELKGVWASEPPDVLLLPVKEPGAEADLLAVQLVAFDTVHVKFTLLESFLGTDKGEVGDVSWPLALRLTEGAGFETTVTFPALFEDEEQ